MSAYDGDSELLKVFDTITISIDGTEEIHNKNR
jgi:sulfatase maturation enzyme AslB (radical SAM superfamily)